MTLITYFPTQSDKRDLPQGFPSPFDKSPHPLAWYACQLLQERLRQGLASEHDFEAPDGGKMFAALVVRDPSGRLGYLAAYSGMLAGAWLMPGFVPPVFDLQARKEFLPAGEAILKNYSTRISTLQNSTKRKALQAKLVQLCEQREHELRDLKAHHKKNKQHRHAVRAKTSKSQEALWAKLSLESQQDKRAMKTLVETWRRVLAPLQRQLAEIDCTLNALRKERAALSNSLQRQVFSAYELTNKRGETAWLTDFFPDKRPPGGAGDCAGPKLVHYAVKQGLTPIALAEFWWGARPAGAIRHHAHYYPACRGKCQPILPFMLKGYDVSSRPLLGEYLEDNNAPYAVYEDEVILAVNKPCGLLSVPGKEVRDSVLTRLQTRYPEATGPLLVHRLDLATSGLLLVAKTKEVHKTLQRQFIKRTIEKRYVAVLSRKLPGDDQGMVELPLCVDILDRPRHQVCFERGKAAKTRWTVISRGQTTTRVYFYPVTGRTHQLRVHASHQKGLNAPIVGDELYGNKDQRLFLHAERLCFTHPLTGERVTLTAPVPF